MAKQDYVPRTHAGFKSWQETINADVTTNATAWAVPATLVAELNTKSAEFESLYSEIDNKNTRTLQQVAAFNQNRIAYTYFLRQLVQGYLVNNPSILYSEKIAMGLNPRTGSRTERPTITSYPIVSFKNIEGGFMQFDSKNSEDGRSARPANADGVELHLQLKTEKPLQVADEDGVLVANAATTDTRIIQSSKTRFIYQFGPAERGNQFTVYGRWYNNSDRSKDGPFGATVTGFIS